MGRNRFPEVTESRILEMAMRLFIEKGYEQTTLQDIADAIGMTRGAIYHHFKSKEDILEAVCDQRMFHKTVPCYDEIIINKEISSLEKIRQILIHALTAKEQVDVYFSLSKSLVYNPKLSAAYLDFTKNNLVAIFSELIIEGMEEQ